MTKDQIVENAINKQSDLRFDYKSAYSNESLIRHITPFASDGKFTVAFCHLRRELRIFRLDRMHNVKSCGREKPNGNFDLIQSYCYELLVNKKVCYYLHGNPATTSIEDNYSDDNKYDTNEIYQAIADIQEHTRYLSATAASELRNVRNYCLRNLKTGEITSIDLDAANEYLQMNQVRRNTVSNRNYASPYRPQTNVRSTSSCLGTTILITVSLIYIYSCFV